MNSAEIEDRATRELERVPDWVWDGEALPVPVEHIADSHFGLLVRDVENLRSAPGVPELPASQGLSGLLLAARGEIWVNASEARAWGPRRRFTIGHELGHWCLHRTGDVVWCRSHSVQEGEPAAPESAPAPEEREANEFAAAVLMPAHLLRRHYEHLRRTDRGRCFELLCEAFGASGAAMSRRLRRVV